MNKFLIITYFRFPNLVGHYSLSLSGDEFGLPVASFPQVALIAHFQLSKGMSLAGDPNLTHNSHLESPNRVVTVAVTHLKASGGFQEVRRKQSEILVRELEKYRTNAIIVCGDMNDIATSSMYQVLSSSLGFQSAYSGTWKGNDRPHGEPITVSEHWGAGMTLDYIWFTAGKLGLQKLLEVPVMKSYLPCSDYPSDHISLMCQLKMK